MLTSPEDLVPGLYFFLDDLWLGCCIVDVDICAWQGTMSGILAWEHGLDLKGTHHPQCSETHEVCP